MGKQHKGQVSENKVCVRAVERCLAAWGFLPSLFVVSPGIDVQSYGRFATQLDAMKHIFSKFGYMDGMALHYWTGCSELLQVLPLQSHPACPLMLPGRSHAKLNRGALKLGSC